SVLRVRNVRPDGKPGHPVDDGGLVSKQLAARRGPIDMEPLRRVVAEDELAPPVDQSLYPDDLGSRLGRDWAGRGCDKRQGSREQASADPLPDRHGGSPRLCVPCTANAKGPAARAAPPNTGG